MDKHFPYNVTDELGEVLFSEERCPGVYFISCTPKTDTGLPCEFYIIEKRANAISSEVKRMGRLLADNPDLLAYALEDVSGGQKIVEYEACKFCVMRGMPLPEGVTLQSLAMDGMETNPEYFGLYPIPYRTPWGYTLRHKVIDNGVYWIETDQCRRVLAICYTLHDELSDAVRELGVQERRDREEGLDNTMGYLFYPKESSCIPIFELMQARPHWESSGIIKPKALENAIWRYFPEYAANYNLQEASGQHDLAGLLLNDLKIPVDLTRSNEKMIAMSPDMDTEFCTLME